MSSPIRLAAAQYPVGQPQHWAEFAAKLQDWVARAAASGAQLLLFPEYAAMELATLLPLSTATDLPAQLAMLQAYLPDYLALHQRLARECSVYLVAGSFPVLTGEGRYVNRAHVFSPKSMSWQDKQIMTRFEREHWGISRGEGLCVFDTAIGRFGINICYDVEFPLLARAQAEAGADLILVPSCTDTLAGYWRVRWGAQARALENQCLTLQAPLVGEAPWNMAVDINVGRAGCFAPPDFGMPDDGVQTLGEWNQAQWIYAALESASLLELRHSGQVLNRRDWAEQGQARLPEVQVIPL